MNAIYPMPTLVLQPRHDDFGTVYLPANIFATQMTSLLGRYLKDRDLAKLENMGFSIIFPNGQPVLPYPVKKDIGSKLNMEA